ncbi:Fibulin-7 [Anabarilius grahami]|uniref:Fibulin-7 n=1 Tax=Anabarilius grahami TaxID=495550 RepID=A0A3N0XJT1_ANAGA|nr:Fibulin-7 [Anabarilius grahami]
MANIKILTVRASVLTLLLYPQIITMWTDYYTVNVLAYTRMMGNGSMDQAVVVLVNDSIFAYFDQEKKTFALRPSASAGFSVLEKRDSIFCLGEVTKGFYRQAEYLEKLKEETNSSKPLLVRPSVSVYTEFPEEEGKANVLYCYATGFYPGDIEINLFLNGRKSIVKVETSDLIYSKDWTFRVYKYMTITPQTGDEYTCEGCMDKHRVMGILRQMDKFLKGQEIRFTEGLRIMKSKLTNLQNSVSKFPQADQSSSQFSCPPLVAPAHGRKFGSKNLVGHEVHFTCSQGYRLMGPGTRVCQENGTWSGVSSVCKATATCWYGKAFLLTEPQNGRATWPSGVERRFGVSGQLWTQTLLRLCRISLHWFGFDRVKNLGLVRKNVSVCGSNPCQNGGTCVEALNQYKCTCPHNWSGSQCQYQTQTAPPEWSVMNDPAFSRKPRCAKVDRAQHCSCDAGFHMSGTSDNSICQAPPEWSVMNDPAFSRKPRCAKVDRAQHCSCDAGFHMSGTSDNSICQDVNECEVYKADRGGPLCGHACVNVPGSYHCSCPTGYKLLADGRSCEDVDECLTQQHNCSRGTTCINTGGGFQCVYPECPRSHGNVSYVKTSPFQCERNPCPMESRSCPLAAKTISYHYLSLPSNLRTPATLFRMATATAPGRPGPDSLRFGIAGGGDARSMFVMQRSDRQTGELILVQPMRGPQELSVEVEMSEYADRTFQAKHLARVHLLISPYEF